MSYIYGDCCLRDLLQKPKKLFTYYMTFIAWGRWVGG